MELNFDNCKALREYCTCPLDRSDTIVIAGLSFGYRVFPERLRERRQDIASLVVQMTSEAFDKPVLYSGLYTTEEGIEWIFSKGINREVDFVFAAFSYFGFASLPGEGKVLLHNPYV